MSQQALIEAAIQRHVGPTAQVVAMDERTSGEQGYSGSLVRYYGVTYKHNGVSAETTLVTKNAPLAERQTLRWLGDQGAPIPWNHTLDLETDTPADVCMQYVGESIWPSTDRAQVAAQTLATIHATNLGRGDEFAWLPRADPTFMEGFIVDACWRRGWNSVRAGQGLIDAFGHNYGPPKSGGDFAGTLDHYTAPLEAAASRFLQATTALWQAGTSLTLIHADFHRDHTRLHEGQAYIIDWGSAHYGSLYIDLPNYFNRDEALLYRDALSALGHDIPVEEFLANYDAVRPYPGFKYFGIGLNNWCYGDPPHRTENVLHFADMVLEER